MTTTTTYTVEVGTSNSREIAEFSSKANALRVARQMFDALGMSAHRAIVTGPQGFYVSATQRHGSGMLWRHA